jgi:hypothetical protein
MARILVERAQYKYAVVIQVIYVICNVICYMLYVICYMLYVICYILNPYSMSVYHI